MFVILFVDSTYGSGAIRPNPIRVFAAYGLSLVGIVYVWQRVREDQQWPCFGLLLVGTGATAAVLLLALQLEVWIADAGHPQSRWRMELMWPLAGMLAGVFVAAVGRGLTRRWSGPPRHDWAL